MLRSRPLGATVLLLAALGGPVLAAPHATAHATGLTLVAGATGRPAPRTPSVHSSDGRPGPRLSADVAGATGGARSRPAATEVVGWQVAPGLQYAEWLQPLPHGLVRVHVLTADLAQKGLVLDQVSGSLGTARAPLSRLLAADHAVAGVNADFFDIDDTGAPLGVGVDRERGLLHAPRAGWNSSLVLDASGTPRIVTDRLVATATVPGHAPLTLDGLNTPHVAGNGTGVYTAAWGTVARRRVVDAARTTREVVVRGGVVRSNRRGVTSTGPISGQVLVGRGRGAAALRPLAVGSRVVVRTALSTPARVAVSGSARLLAAGSVTAPADPQLHPRTAVGIDRSTHTLHLVVVDGRSETSSGVTLRQLAALMRQQGDDDALNLDGGGSSTMVARDPSGRVAVRNAPSDGHERPVPTGLRFRSSNPTG